MSSPTYIPKTKAIAQLQAETGRGRRIIENAIEKLTEADRIHITEDPLDGRILRMTIDDYELLQRVVRGEEPI